MSSPSPPGEHDCDSPPSDEFQFHHRRVGPSRGLRRKTFQHREKPESETPSTSKPKKVTSVPDEQKDDALWERRSKLNEASKRSRDARRQKEEEIAQRCASLEQVVIRQQAEIQALQADNSRLGQRLCYRRKNPPS